MQTVFQRLTDFMEVAGRFQEDSKKRFGLGRFHPEYFLAEIRLLFKYTRANVI